MNPFPENTPAAAALAEAERMIPSLPIVQGPEPECTPPIDQVCRLSAGELLGGKIVDAALAECVKAGLLLRAGFAERSHEVSQNIHSAEGSFWHGIMHRREPDYSNSGYWFRRVGEHPLFRSLAEPPAELDLTELSSFQSVAVKATGGGLRWDPFNFIEACRAGARGPRNVQTELERLQSWEIEQLMRFCVDGALGRG